jgi:hypothetical protein
MKLSQAQADLIAENAGVDPGGVRVDYVTEYGDGPCLAFDLGDSSEMLNLGWAIGSVLPESKALEMLYVAVVEAMGPGAEECVIVAFPDVTVVG